MLFTKRENTNPHKYARKNRLIEFKSIAGGGGNTRASPQREFGDKTISIYIRNLPISYHWLYHVFHLSDCNIIQYAPLNPIQNAPQSSLYHLHNARTHKRIPRIDARPLLRRDSTMAASAASAAKLEMKLKSTSKSEMKCYAAARAWRNG